MNFRIEEILIRDIVDYAASERWANAGTIPITMERALSQQKNPYALPDDPCLWVAISDPDNEVIGFCGTLPGRDFIHHARMGWNSCWWVDRDKGKEAAMPLFYRFLQAWDYRVAFADMTPRTRAIVNQMGFCTTSEEMLLHCYLRLPVSDVVKRLGLLGILILPVAVLAAYIVNGMQHFRIGIAGRKHKGTELESRDRIDHELYDFIQKHRESDFTRHSMDVFRWMEENPWLVTHDRTSHGAGSNYPFSYLVKEFYLKWLVSRRNGEISSVSLISVRNGSLKVLYLFCKHPRDAAYALKNFISSVPRIHALIYTHPDLIPYHKEFRPVALYMKFKKRYRGVSERIGTASAIHSVMQLGDGDSVFT